MSERRVTVARCSGQRGAGLVEYALLAGLFVVALIGGLQFIERQGAARAEEDASDLVVAGGTTSGGSGGPTTTTAGGSTTSTAGGGAPSSSTTSTSAATATTTTRAPTTTTTASPPTTSNPRGQAAQVTGGTARWNWWNGPPQSQGSWVAKVTLQNNQSLGGHVDVKIVKVYEDGTSTEERAEWVSAKGTSSFEIWNLDYKENGAGSKRVVAVTVQPLRIRLTDGTTIAVDQAPYRIEMPAIP
jgi:hypothetical protein